MKYARISFMMLATLSVVLASSGAWAEGALKVKEEIVIREVCDEVWPLIRDFGAPHTWHPAFASTKAEGGNNPGATRVIKLSGGGEIHEKLTKYSKKAMSMSYVITQVDPKVVPVKNYAGRLRLEKEGSRCEVDWASTFDSASSTMSDDEVKKAIAGVYRAGLENIEKMMKAMMK